MYNNNCPSTPECAKRPPCAKPGCHCTKQNLEALAPEFRHYSIDGDILCKYGGFSIDADYICNANGCRKDLC